MTKLFIALLLSIVFLSGCGSTGPAKLQTLSNPGPLKTNLVGKNYVFKSGMLNEKVLNQWKTSSGKTNYETQREYFTGAVNKLSFYKKGKQLMFKVDSVSRVSDSLHPERSAEYNAVSIFKVVQTSSDKFVALHVSQKTRQRKYQGKQRNPASWKKSELGKWGAFKDDNIGQYKLNYIYTLKNNGKVIEADLRGSTQTYKLKK